MGLTQRRKGAKKIAEHCSFLLCAFAPLREFFVVGLLAVQAVGVCVSFARAAEPPPFAEARDETVRYDVATVTNGLDNPVSIAVRPTPRPAGPFELYVSESGAGRIVRLETDKPETVTPVITGFALSDWGTNGKVGPLGVEFLSRTRLAVGTGSLGDGAELVRVYTLPEGDGEVTYDQADHSAGPVPVSGRSETGEGQFYSVAAGENALFVVPHSGDKRGWVLKAILDANRIAGLEAFLATTEVAGVGRPGAAAVDPKPNHHYLVVSQMGELDDSADSRVAMYSPTSGALALNIETGLRDIIALAFSPTGDLYAVDMSFADDDHGGVYRLESAQVDGRESCRAVKIAAAVHPTALAFTGDGALYVTALGKSSDAADKPAGVLLKITPKADAPKL
jgi:hypothetical protein